MATPNGSCNAFAKACIYFNDTGYFLAFEPTNGQVFPPSELVKLNCFAKKRDGVLFVKLLDSEDDKENDDGFPPPSLTAALAQKRPSTPHVTSIKG